MEEEKGPVLGKMLGSRLFFTFFNGNIIKPPIQQFGEVEPVYILRQNMELVMLAETKTFNKVKFLEGIQLSKRWLFEFISNGPITAVLMIKDSHKKDGSRNKIIHLGEPKLFYNPVNFEKACSYQNKKGYFPLVKITRNILRRVN